MGGKAFDEPALELTNDQFSKVEQYTHETLKPFFTSIMTNRHFKDKTTHGDIDLICAWEEARIGVFIRGQERGLGQDAIDPVDENAFKAWITRVCQALRGIEWTRTGTEVHILAVRLPFAVWWCDPSHDSPVPLPVEGQSSIPVKDTPFVQVDLCLVPPTSVDFCQFNFSFGQTLIILFGALRSLSPSITLHATHLGIVHRSHPDVPRVKVLLTQDPREMCEWLGLSYTIWEEGFNDEIEYWTWLSSPLPGRILWTAWERLIKGNDVLPKNIAGQGTRRAKVWNRFYEWLVYSPDNHWRQISETGEVKIAQSSPTLLRHIIPTRPTHGPQTCVKPRPGPQDSMPLDEIAREALERWGKRAEFDTLVNQSTQAAVGIWKRQERKRRNRVTAREHEAARLTRLAEGLNVSDPNGLGQSKDSGPTVEYGTS